MNKLMIISGAGLSAESGISTFRDAGGTWENFKIEEVCDITTFEQNYIKVNDFYDTRRKQLSRVEPNSAHSKIAELSKDFSVLNFTTNVDDLLERAGCENVHHIHGNLLEVVHNYGEDSAEVVNVGHGESGYDDLKKYPVKPNVVFFGEHAPMYEIYQSAMFGLDSDDTIIIVGSSEQVVPFAAMARYGSNFEGRILFVNKDTDLCMNEQINHNVQPFNTTATHFFETFDFETLRK